MTKAEAKKVLSDHLTECLTLMPIDWLRTHGEGSQFFDAYEMALSALNSDEANCDRKIPERGQRAKCNPVDDAIAIKSCVSESDHDWECYALSSGGDEYRCRKCGLRKTFPLSYSVYPTISSN